MDMAQAIFHQIPPNQMNQHPHIHPHGRYHMNGVHPTSMPSTPHTATPLGSSLHNTNGTLRKHIPGTKRKIAPDGKPMTRLPAEIKRFRNSFIFFVNEQRKNKVVDSNSEASGARNRAFIRDMSVKWHNMPEEERAPYVKLANEDKVRYNHEIAEWEEKHPGQGPKVKRKHLPVAVLDEQPVDDSPITAKFENTSSTLSDLGDNPTSAPPTISRDPLISSPTPSQESNSIVNYQQSIKTEANSKNNNMASSFASTAAAADTESASASIADSLSNIVEQIHESIIPMSSTTHYDIKSTTAELGISTSELISALTQATPSQALYVDPAHAMYSDSVVAYEASIDDVGHASNMVDNGMSSLGEMMSISVAELSAMSSIAPTPSGQMSPPIQIPGAISNNPEHLDRIVNSIKQANAIINSSSNSSSNPVQ